MDIQLHKLNYRQLVQLNRILVSAGRLKGTSNLNNKVRLIEQVSKADRETVLSLLRFWSSAATFYLVCRKCRFVHWSDREVGATCYGHDEFMLNYFRHFDMTLIEDDAEINQAAEIILNMKDRAPEFRPTQREFNFKSHEISLRQQEICVTIREINLEN